MKLEKPARSLASSNTALTGRFCSYGPTPVKQWPKPILCEEFLNADPLTRLIRDYKANRNLGFNFEDLQKSGQELLSTSRISIIDALPAEGPSIVMYSGKMCIWCDLILPTYANVSSSFRGPKLYWSKDPDLRKEQGILSAPQLVLYSEGLKVQVLGFGKSNADFLHILEILTELSRSALKGHFAILDDGATRKLYPVRNSETADRIVSGKSPTE